MRQLDDFARDLIHICFSQAAIRQVSLLSRGARQRLSRGLLDLADLASVASRLSISPARPEPRVASLDGLSIAYEIDIRRRRLTLTKVAAA